MGMYQPYQLLAGLLNVLDINWIWTIALSGEMQLGHFYGRRRRRRCQYAAPLTLLSICFLFYLFYYFFFSSRFFLLPALFSLKGRFDLYSKLIDLIRRLRLNISLMNCQAVIGQLVVACSQSSHSQERQLTLS